MSSILIVASDGSSAISIKHHKKALDATNHGGIHCAERIEVRGRMKRSFVIMALMPSILIAGAIAQSAAALPPERDSARWAQEAKHVTIIRDDWGIAHVYGKTDSDAVFGMIYAQCEDDFNRVETNYLSSLGRLAETEGEAKIWQDLRTKLFIASGPESEVRCEPQVAAEVDGCLGRRN
jgi:Penicillin amidase